MMRLLIAAALFGTVSARLGTGEVEQIPSFFGEAAVTVNAASTEVPIAPPSSSIVLTQATIDTASKEEAVQPVSFVAGNLQQVCERTRIALAAQGDASALPGGPVYKECMASLAPLRDHQQDSDAVDTLSDCMALVNALVNVAGVKGGECNVALSAMHASRVPVTAAVVAQPVVSAVPKLSAGKVVEVVAAQAKAVAVKDTIKQEANALDLVSDAMTAVCKETVRDAEVGIKSEGDAMKAAAAVAPICQQYSKKHLGAVAAATPLTTEWCHQLGGRLTIALETGFFFALQPAEAERQAAESNPYAAETRRKFCSRFVNSLRHQAQDGAFYLSGKPAKKQEAAAAKPVAAATAESAAPLPTIPPAPKPVAAPIAVKSYPVLSYPVVVSAAAPGTVPAKAVPVVALSNSAPQQEKPTVTMPFPKGTGVDTLRLVQALSARSEWNAACSGMISRLTSEEGSITEEYALGGTETAQATKVLTFNAGDQDQIKKCAAQLKVLAIQSSDNGKQASLVATGASLSSADDAEAIMDSPWAADACGDIAHGYLTAKLAHPNLAVAAYCPLYARDLQAMHITMPPADPAADAQAMRKRGSKLKRKMAQAPIAPTPALRVPATPHGPPASLITEAAATIPAAAVVASDDEQEGMDFWAGALQ